ncbi:basic leucine zipper transcriptional factor ATF-like 3 isoform X1 [Neovison vison]|uniref:basic leucine zipper transcriptional factor ATF-like 3 isoform X1 n=1 Tax=Neovison vison TaxID=452646 RepID=UPI001CF00531|nr:basic leucine zipper transcriptional factor ATF-like 3 isoform X1 [Neogale vison]
MSQVLPAAGSVLQRSVAAPGNQPQPQSPDDDDRKVRRREKNRVAAQRSRKKQTQKADKLHEVSLWSGQSHIRATERSCGSGPKVMSWSPPIWTRTSHVTASFQPSFPILHGHLYPSSAGGSSLKFLSL